MATSAHSLSSLLVLFCIAGASAAKQSCPTCVHSIVVLGDELSDSGLPNGLWSRNNDTFPSPAFGYQKGHFTNGNVWVEDLATSYGLTLLDYAVGGAGVNPFVNWTSLSDELSSALFYLKTANFLPPVLGVVAIGQEDILNLQYEPFARANNVSAVLAWANNTVAGIVQAAQSLLSLQGVVSHVLVIPTFSSVRKTTALRSASATQQAQTNELISSMTAGLNASLNQINAASGSNSTVIYADISKLLKDIIANPKVFDLTNATAPCLVFDPPNSDSGLVRDATTGAVTGQATLASNCSDPKNYLFWDTVNPTAAGHRIIAKYIAEVLSAHNLLPK